MAVLKLDQAQKQLEKEHKKFEAVERKMELQQKKMEFGEGWKEDAAKKRLKDMSAVIGGFTEPLVINSVDYNEFLEPINLYRDEKGAVREWDYKKYIDAEGAYANAIQEQEEIISGTGVKIDIQESAQDQLNELLSEGKKKSGRGRPPKNKDKEGKPKIQLPEYLQNCYTKWVKYLSRLVPVYDKYVCTCCGRPLAQDEYFLIYNETNWARIEPNGKMHSHICINCCKKLFEYLFYERAEKDGEKAMQWLCSYLNVYYDRDSYFQARKIIEAKDNTLHIVEAYMQIINRSATLKGKVFLDSKDAGFNGVQGEDKDVKIINSNDGNVSDDLEHGWTKADLEAKRLVLKMVGYDPFYYEEEEKRKILYKDLLGMIESGMELDGLKVQGAIQIVLSFSRIREYNEKERQMMDNNASVTELKALADLKSKQLQMITNFSRDNGFGERYAVAKAKGENTLTGIMAKMNTMKFEKAILNQYDIQTSASINQAAEASIQAIFKQLNLSEAEVYKVCQEQLKRLNELQREKDALQEKLRLAKREIAEMQLEEQKKEYDLEHPDGESWGGY